MNCLLGSQKKEKTPQKKQKTKRKTSMADNAQRSHVGNNKKTYIKKHCIVINYIIR